MSASAESRPLIIGVGNPLRGDDGLGWVVAQQLERELGEACQVLTVHQLTPELVPGIAAACLVILIDASVAGQSGDVQVRRGIPRAQSEVLATHHYTPEALIGLTEALYGTCPPIYVVSMTGSHFDMGEQLSPTIARQVPAVIAAVRRLCEMPYER